MGAFRADELSRIKAELGYNVLNVGADAYVGVTAMFETVVNEYIDAAVSTTSTATIEPGQRTLTLASAVGFTEGQRVVADVDERQELVTVQSLSGTSLTALFAKAHTGTFPVTVEGPVTIARDALAQIARVKSEMSETLGEGSLQQVDEVKFYQVGGAAFAGGDTLFESLGRQASHWRDELASALGVPNMWTQKQANNLTLSVY